MSGTPWLLLRGLMRETRHWGDFAERLSAAAGVPVITLDLIGNGRRCAETSPLRVADMAADLDQQWRDTHGGPVQVFALSMGGMVATEWARQSPALITRLVLCNTSLRPFSRLTQRFQPQAWPSLMKMLLTRQAAGVIEAGVLELTSGDPARHRSRLGDWARWRLERPVSTANVLRQLYAAARYHADQPPPVPTTILCSEGDRLVSSSCSKQLAAGWQRPLAVHPSAGHDLPLDDPDWVIKALLG